MHSAHRIGHAVGRGTRRHVVGVKGTTRTAAARNGEVLDARFVALFFIGARDGVLESRGVGGVARYGHAHFFQPHDLDALAHVVRAVATDLSALSRGVRRFLDYLHLVVEVIHLGLHIRETVDTRNDHRRVFAETVEDNAERGLADLVRALCDTYRALCRRERLVTREEAEALRLLFEQHGGKVAVAETDFTLFCDGAGYAERLQALAYRAGGVCGTGATLFDRNGATQRVCPLGVFETDVLYALGYLVGVEALVRADLQGIFKAVDAVFFHYLGGFSLSSLISFESYSHIVLLIRGEGR